MSDRRVRPKLVAGSAISDAFLAASSARLAKPARTGTATQTMLARVLEGAKSRPMNPTQKQFSLNPGASRKEIPIRIRQPHCKLGLELPDSLVSLDVVRIFRPSRQVTAA